MGDRWGLLQRLLDDETQSKGMTVAEEASCCQLSG